MKLLILCTGNSCRSQMAHGYLQSLNPDLQVFSAGTHPAGYVNPYAIKVMNEKGIDISHHTSDPVDFYLNESWDYVITVCGGANETCPAFSGKVKHRLHIGFEDPADAQGKEEEVIKVYRKVRDQIFEAFYKLYTVEIAPSL